MKKIMKQCVCLLAFLSLVACQPSSQEAVQVVSLSKSHSAKDAGISLQFSELKSLNLGMEYSVELTWTASANKIIELTPVNRDEYLWTSSVRSLSTDEQGVVDTVWRFVPQREGRAYLKIQAVTSNEQGLVSKVFNIPFTVLGASEEKQTAKKLMLPVESL